MEAALARAKNRQRKRRDVENTPREWPPADLVIERWGHNGMECVIAQGFDLCGYVKVPPNHAASGKHYDNVDVDVHGGLTFCQRAMDGGWWLGFDTSHGGDRLVFPRPNGHTLIIPGTVWTRETVKAEVERLADQL